MFARMGAAFSRLGLVVTGHGVAGGGTLPPPPTVFLAMDMSDFRNTYILGL